MIKAIAIRATKAQEKRSRATQLSAALKLHARANLGNLATCRVRTHCSGCALVVVVFVW